MPLGTAEETKTIHQERRWQARETAGMAKMQAVFISDCSESLDFPWGNLSTQRRIQTTILFSKQHHFFEI